MYTRLNVCVHAFHACVTTCAHPGAGARAHAPKYCDIRQVGQAMPCILNMCVCIRTHSPGNAVQHTRAYQTHMWIYILIYCKTRCVPDVTPTHFSATIITYML